MITKSSCAMAKTVILVALLTISAFPELVHSLNFLRIPKSLFVINGPARFLFDNRARDQVFKVYWNAPTIQCRQHGILFDNITQLYGIRQNDGDTFRGNEISILYDPGKFPALLENPGSKDYYYRNGGVPQEGSLEEHTETFREHLDQLIPDELFSGVGVIDFESWRPVFRQNFGTLQPYKDVSYKIERENHPFWPQDWIHQEATKRFETSGREYMEETLKIAREARPLAKWGYYAFPYCFNMQNNKVQNCPDNVKEENDGIQWLWDESDAIFPSVYLPKNRLNAAERLQMIKGRIAEAKRLSSKTPNKPKIFSYFWYKYQDEQNTFVTEEDVYNALNHMKGQGIAGMILWGSSNDVNNKDKCIQLRNYVDTILGPTVQKFVPRQKTKTNISI